MAARADAAPEELRAPVAAFRGALLVLCAVLSALASARTYAALPIAVLGCFAIVAERWPPARKHRLATGLVEAALTGLGVVGTSGSVSPLLPYLLAPPMCIALVAGVRSIALVSLASAATLLVGRVGLELLHHGRDPVKDFATVSAQFVLLALALGVVASRARRLTAEPAVTDRFAEARTLLRDLRAISRRLPGGLDAASAGDALLSECAAVVTPVRAAVMVMPAHGALTPISVRGTRRVPWREPLSQPGPLHDAWHSLRPVVDQRPADTEGRRRGSAIAVLPLVSDGAAFGLVVLESYELGVFTPAAVTALVEHVRSASLRLETALLFDEVRTSVTVEERDRLAREMHDGVAQELAFIGYQLDDLRLQTSRLDVPLGERVRELRGEVTGLISNLRMSITDLKTSVGNERGLGAVLSSYVRAIGSGRGLQVHLSLDESAFRLPGEQELLLFQIAQTVAQDVRRAGTASNLWVRLSVAPPYAKLVVEHDGSATPDEELLNFVPQVTMFGGKLAVRPRPDGDGAFVVVVLEGGSDDVDGHARRRPRADPAGAAPGVRADP